MKKSRNKKEKLMYFPSVKKSLNLGIVVSMTTIAVSVLITGINMGMTWLMSII